LYYFTSVQFLKILTFFSNGYHMELRYIWSQILSADEGSKDQGLLQIEQAEGSQKAEWISSKSRRVTFPRISSRDIYRDKFDVQRYRCANKPWKLLPGNCDLHFSTESEPCRVRALLFDGFNETLSLTTSCAASISCEFFRMRGSASEYRRFKGERERDPRNI